MPTSTMSSEAEFEKNPGNVEFQPAEVGWQFVQEYFTILNKDPSRLHCFYNKSSYMMNGTEGESIDSCIGQKSIQARIQNLDLRNSRVIINNVDSQPSMSGGILVCVLGEMAIKSAPKRRFAQTFFLAQQPNGYYVLNDIFRFLNGDSADDSADDDANAYHHPHNSAENELVESSQAAPHPAEPEVPNDSDNLVESPVTEKKSFKLPEKAEVVNGKSEKPSAEIVPEPKDQVPNKPKTWARLAEKGKERWAGHVSEVQGKAVPVSEAPAKGNSGNKEKQSRGKLRPEATVFIRGYTRATKVQHLKDAFSSKIGTVKWVDLVTENSAFIEFVQAEHAKKALSQGKVEVNGQTIEITDKKRNGQNRKNRRNSRPNP